MAGRVLAITGGRLIDGTGRPPIENAVIIIENGRFKAIGNAQSLPVPADAEVVDVAGKTVMPGFMDGHGHLEDFHGDLYLHLGITSVFNIQSFQDGPWSLAQKRGTELGKIRGPRIFVSGRAIGGDQDAPEGLSTSKILRGHIVVNTAEAARNAVRRKKELGCDLIKVNEFLDFPLAKSHHGGGAQLRHGCNLPFRRCHPVVKCRRRRRRAYLVDRQHHHSLPACAGQNAHR